MKRSFAIAAAVIVVLVVVIVGVIVAVSYDRANTYSALGDSMTPSIKAGEQFKINPLHDAASIQRNWIVIFKPPPNVLARGETKMVKRVVGLPGDSVEAKGGHLFVNGNATDEPFLAAGTKTDDFAAITVPPGSVFVLGDHRENSSDSRFYGPIQLALIEGHVTKR